MLSEADYRGVGCRRCGGRRWRRHVAHDPVLSGLGLLAAGFAVQAGVASDRLAADGVMWLLIAVALALSSLGRRVIWECTGCDYRWRA